MLITEHMMKAGKNNMRGYICYKTKPKYMFKDSIPRCPHKLVIIKHKHLRREVCRRKAQKATVDKIAENATEHLFWVWVSFIKIFPG